tara:strand:- start:40 stop:1488 length:1449 start_codon:yes stop_codon:yes gene_type:complete
MVFPVVGGDGKPTGYEIDNSLRFNDGDSPFLQRAFTGGSRTTYTFSTWVKRSHLGSNNKTLLDGFKDANNNTLLFFHSTDTLRFFAQSAATTYVNVRTNQVFRDLSAWYHIVLAVDTTQGTETNRVKIYVNGSQVTSFSTYSVLENYASFINDNTRVCTVGAADSSGGEGDFMDGYLAETHFVDGAQKAASDFGETNDNGVWIPKDCKADLTYGTNGFYLEFKQTGTGTASASTIGADTSGEDNHLTSNNLAATDVTVDTPTNNFCTLNPLADANLAGATFSEGNCKVDVGKSGVESGVISTFLLSSGKWYWESKMIDRQTASTFMIGVVASQVTGTGTIANYAGNKFLYSNNGDIHDTGASGDNGTDYGNTYDEGDIVGVALDLDNNKIYWSINGTFQASGDPANNSNGHSITAPASTNLGGYIAGFGGFQTYSHVIEINFGNAPYAISSGNADANGHGNFEYAVPSGFFACCTKNLAEQG